MATSEQLKVFDSSGLQSFASAMFAIIEATYVRRTTYEARVTGIVERIDTLDAIRTYAFDINSTSGNLTLAAPDDAEVDLEINNEGYLILNSNDTNFDKVLERYRFNIDDSGDLIATYDTTA